MKVTMKRRAPDRAIPAGEFKAKCLSLLDEVAATGRSIVVSKRGRPVARVVPLPTEPAELHGSIVAEQDLVSPIDEAWDAES